jgi:hypothetical protein
MLPSPFLLPLLVCSLATQRAYEAKLPGLAKRSMGPTSSRMTVARVWPMPGAVASSAWSRFFATLS